MWVELCRRNGILWSYSSTLIVNSLQIYSCLQLTCLLLRQNPFLKHELAFLNLRCFLIVLLATENTFLKAIGFNALIFENILFYVIITFFSNSFIDLFSISSFCIVCCSVTYVISLMLLLISIFYCLLLLLLFLLLLLLLLLLLYKSGEDIEVLRT